MMAGAFRRESWRRQEEHGCCGGLNDWLGVCDVWWLSPLNQRGVQQQQQNNLGTAAAVTVAGHVTLYLQKIGINTEYRRYF